MARRKKRNSQSGGLKVLIGMLAVILCGLLILAAARQEEPNNALQTDPPQQTDPPAHTTTGSTPPTSEETWPLRIGWAEINGKTYYFEGGAPVQGAHTIEGKLYCFDVDGALLGAGWQELGGSRYYLNADGSAVTGWLELEDGKYFLRKNGTMARGEEEIDGVRYYFTSAGRHIYLVNPWNYVPEGYRVDLKTLPGHIAEEGEKVDASCYDALVKMMEDCKAAGYKVCVISSYRTHAYQEYLFNRQVDKQMAALNCTREEAEKIAATISAIPGTSEHQLGLAVDIIDTHVWELSEVQETLAGQQWLMENSWRYGFILRYPNGTTNETGIIYEPWHYRYVGIEVATELHESGQTLEGYLAALE